MWRNKDIAEPSAESEWCIPFCNEKGHIYTKRMKACEPRRKASSLASCTAQNERGHGGGELLTPAAVNAAWRQRNVLKGIAKTTWEENKEGGFQVVGGINCRMTTSVAEVNNTQSKGSQGQGGEKLTPAGKGDTQSLF